MFLVPVELRLRNKIMNKHCGMSKGLPMIASKLTPAVFYFLFLYLGSTLGRFVWQIALLTLSVLQPSPLSLRLKIKVKCSLDLV